MNEMKTSIAPNSHRRNNGTRRTNTACIKMRNKVNPWNGKNLKVQVYSLISSLISSHQPTLHFTPWSLDLFIRVPFQLHGEHTVQQPFRRIKLIVHIAFSVLPGTHLYLSQVEHARVKCNAQRHKTKQSVRKCKQAARPTTHNFKWMKITHICLIWGQTLTNLNVSTNFRSQ